jgi:hypothetical protein
MGNEQCCSTTKREREREREVKLLGMHLDRMLTWAKYIKAKINQLTLRQRERDSKSERKQTRKINIISKKYYYTAVLKPIWTYGVQLWGPAPNFNIEILQRFQSDFQVFTKCTLIYEQLQDPCRSQNDYSEKLNMKVEWQMLKFGNHLNALAMNLLGNSEHGNRLKRY